mmetsp:Transcript_17046/g.15398  ORF Transcript_17046/g.15398 Transcript_17046/m.15398 type:complete len:525 (-) Transcript_17046:47-1621(-)
MILTLNINNKKVLFNKLKYTNQLIESKLLFSTNNIDRKWTSIPSTSSTAIPLSQQGGVHGNWVGGSNRTAWRNKPLFRRDGVDRVFRSGAEATQLLLSEANRKDAGSKEFLQSWESMVTSLSVVFERMPKYAWVMKQLLEPERTITFRVPWIDDSGISRVNRGFRAQYSSALGPYAGGTSFSSRVTISTIKALAFDTTFSTALSGVKLGGAYGGADFNPYNKSETEIQRFCQSYMTELSKYIGPDVDLPGMGEGVTSSEIGYLYGQYKRLNHQCGQFGSGLLWGGSPANAQAQGHGVVCFAKRMLEDKGLTLEGKKCLVTGSHYVALAVAEKLLEFGAIPISFSDTSGHVVELNGFNKAKFKTLQTIKSERGARIGRYILASTTAKFNDPPNVYDLECDFAFPCSSTIAITESDIAYLSSRGCQGIIEGVQQAMTNGAITAAKKKGLLLGPYRATTSAGALFYNISDKDSNNSIDYQIFAEMSSVYEELKSTSKEFNTRGDLHAAADIASFLRVADVMLVHGAV